ncbi:MAG: hypothetical protein JST04_04955 [Bdellovibrionales bacterium]|nr:hypothetical protein [Bdellovibrionales bacterium]
MRWISSLVVLFPIVAHAAEFTGDFCDARTRGTMTATIDKIADDRGMRIAFENDGGLAGGGVCWWHSRLQRAAWYLARFDAMAPAPTRDEAKRLVRRLVSRKEVVTIPGYADFRSFTKDFEPVVQSELNAWQLRDAFINQAYLRGLSGVSHYRHPEKFRARLEKVFTEYNEARARGDVVWVMLQMRGIASHASLIRGMELTPDGGFRIAMVDSNFPDKLVEYVARPGDLELNPSSIQVDDYTSVPYAGFTRDLRRIHRAVERYCDPDFKSTPAEDAEDADDTVDPRDFDLLVD